MTKELALRPTCLACGVFLELRNPPGGCTFEERFCGTWYDHPIGGTCTRNSTVLLPSPELIAQEAELRAAARSRQQAFDLGVIA